MSCTDLSSARSSAGRLFGVGVGPGDPDLITRRAERVIRAVEVVAHFAARRQRGNAWHTIESLLRDDQVVERLEYPITTEQVAPEVYRQQLDDFYAESASRLAAHLRAGRDVAVVSEGDPLFYGSYMHLHLRLSPYFVTEVVPGVTAFCAASAAAGTPLVSGDEQLRVIPGTLGLAGLRSAVSGPGAVVIMKVGRHLATVTAALEEAGRHDQAVYVERVSLPGERIARLTEVGDREAPYFSVVLVPGERLATRLTELPT